MFAEALCLNYGSKLEICSGKSNTNEHKVSFILYGHTPHHLKGEILITDATSTSTSHPTHSEPLSTPREASYRGAQIRPRLVRSRSCIASDCCRESYPLFRVLRHRTPSSPICLSEVSTQALHLIVSILLIQRREKCPSREEKSAFS